MSDIFNTTGSFAQLKDRFGSLAARRLVYIPKPIPMPARRTRPVGESRVSTRLPLR